MPVIKREESPEVMPGSAPTAMQRDDRPNGLPSSLPSVRPTIDGHSKRYMPPPPPKSYPEALSAHSAPSSGYTGSSPHKYTLAPFAGRFGVRTPPALLSSSRLQHVIATGAHNKPETRAPFNTTGTTLPHISNLTALLSRNDDCLGAKRKRTSNDMAEYVNGRAFDLEKDGEMVMISRGQLFETRAQLVHLEGAREHLMQQGQSIPGLVNTTNLCTVNDHQAVIRELVSFNRRLHITVEDLNQRLARIETGHPAPLQGAFTSANEGHREERAPAARQTLRFRSEVDERSQSPSSDYGDYRERNDARGGRGVISKRVYSAKKGGRGLQIEIPGTIRTGLPVVGLPTPITADMVCSSPRAMSEFRSLYTARSSRLIRE